MQPAELRVRRRFSALEVERMVDRGVLAEGEPLELLDGELVVVSPQGPAHAARIESLRQRLSRAYGEAFHVRDQKPLAGDPESLPEPDLAVARGAPLDYEASHPAGSDVVLVVEIAKTSVVLDRSKARNYARAGAPVYWLLDLEGRQLEVRSGPRQGAYASCVVLSDRDEVALPDLDLRWRVAALLP